MIYNLRINNSHGKRSELRITRGYGRGNTRTYDYGLA